MSFQDFREITVDNPGSSIRYGGNDLKEIMQIFNSKTVLNRKVRISNPWCFEQSYEMKNVSATPSDPPANDRVIIYPRATSANSNGWFAKTRENNTFVEVRIF